MSKRASVILGLSLATAFGLIVWVVTRQPEFSILNAVCVLVGWFSGDLFKWIRKRLTA